MVARITSFCPLMPDKQSLTPPGDYEQFLTETKDRIRRAQVRAALAVNGEVILLYWVWDVIFWNVKLLKAGGVKSLIACPKT